MIQFGLLQQLVEGRGTYAIRADGPRYSLLYMGRPLGTLDVQTANLSLAPGVNPHHLSLQRLVQEFLAHTAFPQPLSRILHKLQKDQDLSKAEWQALFERNWHKSNAVAAVLHHSPRNARQMAHEWSVRGEPLDAMPHDLLRMAYSALDADTLRLFLDRLKRRDQQLESVLLRLWRYDLLDMYVKHMQGLGIKLDDLIERLPAADGRQHVDAMRTITSRTLRKRAMERHVLRGLPVRKERFAQGQGKNFMLVPRTPIHTVIAAHHDRVPGVPGANDNGAAAVQLAAAARRAWTPDSGVLVAWTDYEEPETSREIGEAMGSGGRHLSQWVASQGAKPKHVIVLDVTGHGDTINVSRDYEWGPGTTALIERAAHAAGMPVSKVHTPPSDNISWQPHGNLVSTMRQEDLKSGKRPGWHVLHSPHDDLQQIDHGTMEKMAEFLSHLIKLSAEDAAD